MRQAIILGLLAALMLAGAVQAVEVTIDPGDCGTPAEGRLARLRCNLPDYWDKSGVQTRDAILGTTYWINIESGRIGEFTVTQNPDGLTYDLATTGGLIPGPAGDTALEEGQIVVMFNNAPVVINMGNYLGGWTIGGNITNWQDKGTEKTVSLPKNTIGGIWMFYGHVGNGNHVYIKVDDAGNAVIDSFSREGLNVTTSGNTIQFSAQEITITPPATLRDNGVNWWAIDGGGDYRYNHESGEFPPKVCALFPGEWTIYGDAGMPQAKPVVPADATGWSESIPTGYGTWVLEGPLPPGIESFTVTDQSTGSELATNSPDVNISLVGEGTPDGYLVTETPDQPTEGWLPEPPATYTITGPEGMVTLYGWVKTGEAVAGVSHTILYSTPQPTVSDVVFTPVVSGTVTVEWTTDIPSEGFVKLVPAAGGDEAVFAENAVGTTHAVTMTNVAEVTSYLVTLVNTEWEEEPIPYFYSLTVPVKINPGTAGCPAQGVNASYSVLGPKPYEWWCISGEQVKNIPPGEWIRVYIQDTDIGRFRVVKDEKENPEDPDTYTVETDPAYGGLIGSKNVGFNNVEVRFNNVDLYVNMNGYQGGHMANWLSGPDRTGDVLLSIPKGNSGGSGYQFFWGHTNHGNRFKFNVAADGTVTVTESSREGVNFTGGMRTINFPFALPATVQTPADLVCDWWAVDWGGLRGGSGSQTVPWNTLPGGWTLLVNGPNGFKAVGFSVPADAIDWSTTVSVPDYGDFIISVPATVIRNFSVADRSTGSTVLTNEATVDVSLSVDTAAGETIEGYKITEDDIEPTEGWATDPPATYTIQGGEGDVTLYLWVKTTTLVARGTCSIRYSTDALEVSNLNIFNNGDGTVAVKWDTNLPAAGQIQYRAVGAPDFTTTVVEGALFTSHSALMTGILPETNYEITLVNNEIAGEPFFWPNTWPIPGDANLDCKVNILDLILVRNRLNQSPGTGDNWQADVNIDGKINILDLIFVRNNLNNRCEE